MTPLVEIPHDAVDPLAPDIVEETMARHGMSEDDACELLLNYHDRVMYFANNLYHVEVEPYGPGCLHLCIWRRDGDRVRDWRHFQTIKNALAGPEREAVELYPAESRKVDTSHKWHLWVLPEGSRMALGWTERNVKEETP